MSVLLKLNSVLNAPSDFDWRHSLFLPQERPWQQASDCAVIDIRYEDDESPSFAVKNKLRYALDIATVQDIISNAREQKVDCSIDDLLGALNYYFDQDAFIRF